jgi:hypothetical protein
MINAARAFFLTWAIILTVVFVLTVWHNLT